MGTKMLTSWEYGEEFLYSKLYGMHKRRSKILIVQGFGKLLSKNIFLEIISNQYAKQYLSWILSDESGYKSNNICIGY